MRRIDGLPGAAASAIGGVRAADERLARSAASIARQGAGLPDQVSLSQGAAPAGEPGALAAAMVDLRVARYQLAASVAVLRTVDEVSGDVVDIVRPRK